MICLSSARFTMKATVLKQGNYPSDPSTGTGTWENSQDPITGEIVSRWVDVDDPSTPTNDESSREFQCLARSVISTGVRNNANTEHFGSIYDELEFVRVTYPTNVLITKHDRITNIRDSKGNVAYIDYFTDDTNPTPTTFNVDGVIPVYDYTNMHIENMALLSRAE